MSIPKPCADVPDQLWISAFREARPAGNRNGNPKFPWTPALLAQAVALRRAGATWGSIARALEKATGVLLSEDSVQDYVTRRE